MEEYFKKVRSINVEMLEDESYDVTYTLTSGKTIQTNNPTPTAIKAIKDLANMWLKEDIENMHRMFAVGTRVITTYGRGVVSAINHQYARFTVDLDRKQKGVASKTFPWYEMVLDKIPLDNDCEYQVKNTGDSGLFLPERLYVFDVFYNYEDKRKYIQACTENCIDKNTPNLIFDWNQHKNDNYIQLDHTFNLYDMVITPEGVGYVKEIFHESDTVIVQLVGERRRGSEVFRMENIRHSSIAKLKLHGCYDYTDMTEHTTERIMITDMSLSFNGFADVIYTYRGANEVGNFTSDSYMEHHLVQVTSETP